MKTPSDVIDRLSKLAQLNSKQLDPDTIVFFSDILHGQLTSDEACKAIAQWAATQTRWPAPADLIQLIKPKATQRDEASALAQGLIALIGRRGYTWEHTYKYDGYSSVDEAVQAELGDTAIAVVRRCGGWAAFCRQYGGEEGDGTLRAQLRDLCSAIAVTPTASRGLLDPMRKSTGQPMAIGDIMRAQLPPSTATKLEIKHQEPALAENSERKAL